MDPILRQQALDYHEFPTPGKISIQPTKQLTNQRDLALAYSPGVAAACLEIAQDPMNAFKYTARGNLVGVVTNGTAVLGLGDIGPLAAKPVMEGKGVLFKKFAGIDVFDIELAERDLDKIVDAVAALEPTFGGINLEDIKAPDCFYIERKLRERMKIPVFHDDQHGTAIVVLAALLNALKVTGKRIEDITVAMIGTGAAGVACAKLLAAEGVKDIVAADRNGILHAGRDDISDSKRWFVDEMNRTNRSGSMIEVLDGADMFLGLSGPNLFEASELARMAPEPIVFTLANPVSEVDPIEARHHAAVVATGRSDHPNQINNVLAFPGIFRGALDARARFITESMKMAAARAIADVIPSSDLRADYIIPSAFNDKVAPAVADAVRQVAEREAR